MLIKQKRPPVWLETAPHRSNRTRLSRQAFAALSPATRNDNTAIFSGHARTITVATLANNFTGLVCAFHCNAPLTFILKKSEPVYKAIIEPVSIISCSDFVFFL
jgi:hypothetical protein